MDFKIGFGKLIKDNSEYTIPQVLNHSGYGNQANF